MVESKQTLGQAIDQIIGALEGLNEDARITAISAVCKHLNIEISPGVQRPSSVAQPGSHLEQALPSALAQLGSGKHHGKLDIRTLKEDKKPKSALQMACIVAYYLQEIAPESERKETISTPDIEKYFKQAKFELPKRVEQVLKDAKNAGYFEKTGSRGEYKLNAVGYNLVVHGLPAKKES